MRRIDLTDADIRVLNSKKMLFKRNSVLKHSPLTYDLLKMYDEKVEGNNRNLITMPKSYLYHDGIFQGYEMERLKKYKTVADALMNGASINKYELIKQVIDIVLYLESKGILYFDLHLLNVMVSGNDFKLIDIDDAVIKDEYSDYTVTRETMLDFALSLLAYNGKKGEKAYTLSFTNLMNNIKMNQIYSKELMEYFDLVFHYDRVVNFIDIRKYLPEMVEVDRVKKLQKEISIKRV